MNPKRIDLWLFEGFPVTAYGLAVYRIAYALFVLLILDPGHSAYFNFRPLAELPDSFFLPPPGPMQLLGGFPPSWFFNSLHVALDLSLVALLLGYRTQLASWLIGTLFLIGFGFLFSAGKINHVLLFVLLPWLMSFTNWGAAWSLDARQGRTRPEVASWPLALLALLVGFALFTAGFTKLIGGWLDPTTQATQGHWLKQYFIVGRQDLLAELVTYPWPVGLWELLDWGTVFLELGFLPAAFVPRAFRLFLAGMVGFHLSTALLLNITFVQNLIVYAAFLNWNAVAAWLKSRFSIRVRVPVLPLLPILTALFYFWGSPLRRIDRLATFHSDLSLLEVLTNALGFGVVLVLALQAGVRRLKKIHFPVPTAFLYRRAFRGLALWVGLYALLVATHTGEFWPMSVFPMFSQAGKPWTRIVVRELTETDSLSWNPIEGWTTLPGQAFALKPTGITPLDLTPLVLRAQDSMHLATLRLWERTYFENRRLLVLQAQGKLSEGDVQVTFTPLLLLHGDTVIWNPQRQP